MSVTVEREPQRALHWVHPVHAVLLAGTVPLFLGAMLSDIAYSASYEIQWSNFASWLIVGGLVFGGAVRLPRWPTPGERTSGQGRGPAVGDQPSLDQGAGREPRRRFLYVGIGSNSNITERGLVNLEPVSYSGEMMLFNDC